MHVTYAPRNPQDGERQEWDFDPDDILISEAELVQRHFGGTWDEFSVAVQKGDAKARRVLLWMLMRREHKAIQVRDVPDFRTGELKVEHSVAELLDLQEKIVGADMPPAQQQMMVAAFEVELAEAAGVRVSSTPPRSRWSSRENRHRICRPSPPLLGDVRPRTARHAVGHRAADGVAVR
jgi:hypothetical protein